MIDGGRVRHPLQADDSAAQVAARAAATSLTVSCVVQAVRSSAGTLTDIHAAAWRCVVSDPVIAATAFNGAG
jgi:hypothetical protein